MRRMADRTGMCMGQKLTWHKTLAQVADGGTLTRQLNWGCDQCKTKLMHFQFVETCRCKRS